MLTLKTVSGRLKELFRGRAPAASPEPGSRNLLVVDDEERFFFVSEYFSQHGSGRHGAREEESEGLIRPEYKGSFRIFVWSPATPDGIGSSSLSINES